MSGRSWEKIPGGWEGDAFFERILSAGYCAIDKILDGTISVDDVFKLHAMLDYRDFRELKAREKAGESSPNVRN